MSGLLRCTPRSLWLALLVLTTGLIFAQDLPPAPSSQEAQRILAIVARVGPFRLVDGPTHGFSLGLGNQNGHPLGMLNVVPNVHLGTDRPRVRTRHYALTIANFTPDGQVTETLVRAAHAVVAWDGGALREQPARIGAPETNDFIPPTQILLGLAVLATVWRRGRVTFDVRTVHIIQMVTQTSIFLYWGLYWPAVGPQLPVVGMMLVMGFAADAFFSFLRFGSWRAGFSVVPVVLSINLFEWFDVRGAVLTVVVAFASKHLVHRRGRHIVNPSVGGLTVTGLATLVAPDWIHFGGLFHTLNVPPNMAEWLLIVTIVPQLRVRILPISIGMLIALTLWHIPGVLRPTIIIAMTLLATDPATSPTTDLGKLFFGLMYGGLLPAASIALRRHGDPDDFAKVLAIPVVNLLVPQIDAVAAWITARVAAVRDLLWKALAWVARLRADTAERWGARVRRPIPNVLFVVCWLAYIVPRLQLEKPSYFESEIHWNYGTPMVVRGADDIPRCADNPVFCRVFSFPQEAALWLRRLRHH